MADCDCGVGEAQNGGISQHRYGCSLFITDSDHWRAAHADLMADRLHDPACICIYCDHNWDQTCDCQPCQWVRSQWGELCPRREVPNGMQ